MPSPATARISPFGGRITTTPPSWPPSASTAARWTRRGDRCAHRRARPAPWRVAITRAPASSSPPGLPRSCGSNARSRPLVPTVASRRARPGIRAPSVRRRESAPTFPTTEDAAAPSGEGRSPSPPPAAGAPSASTEPSRASSAARGGSAVWRVSRSPAAQAREEQRSRPNDRAGPSFGAHVHAQVSAAGCRRDTCARASARPRPRPPSSCTCVLATSPVVVAVIAAGAVGRGERWRARPGAASARRGPRTSRRSCLAPTRARKRGRARSPPRSRA